MSRFKIQRLLISRKPCNILLLKFKHTRGSRITCIVQSRYQETPLLIICKFPYKDVEKEKPRNRFPLKTIMEQNPLSYKAIRFTTEATIKSIDPNRDWYYVSCHQCNKVAISLGENYCCLDHGPQPGPFFRYKFKGRIADSSVTAPMTFFSPAADKTTRNPCNELVEKYKPADPKKLPTEILMIQGKTTIFQFHFNTFANTTDLSLDDVFDIKTTDQGTNSAPEQMHKGTSSTSTEATQPVTDRGKIKRKKQK